MRLVYPLLMVFLASTVFAQKIDPIKAQKTSTAKVVKADSLKVQKVGAARIVKTDSLKTQKLSTSKALKTDSLKAKKATAIKVVKLDSLKTQKIADKKLSKIDSLKGKKVLATKSVKADSVKTKKIIVAKVQKPDTLITPTDTLVFVKDTVKLTKLEMLVRQATLKQYKPAEAIALYQKALAAKTKAQDSNWVADIRLAMAKMYFKQDNSRDGFLNLLAAQSLYSQAMNMSCQSSITKDIAEIYEASNDWNEAERYYLLAIKQQENVGLTIDMPYTLLSLANGYYKRKEYDKAEKYYASALNQFELNNEKNKRAEALVQLADIKVKQKNYAQAEYLILKRAMPFFSAVGKPYAKIACFNMLGDIYYIQNRLSEAKWFYIQASTMYKNNADFDGVVRSMVNLAKVKSAIGDQKAALKDFKEAEAMAIRSKKLALAADVKIAYAKYYNKPKTKDTEVKAVAAKPVTKKDAAVIVPAKEVSGEVATDAKADKTIAKVVPSTTEKAAISSKTLVKTSEVKIEKVALVKDKKPSTLVKTEKVAKEVKPVAKSAVPQADKVLVNSDKVEVKEETAIVKEDKSSSDKDEKVVVAEN